jgi:hypothetical protein
MTLDHQDAPPEKFSTGTAFLLWLTCLIGLCGVHRLYLGKTFSGILYLFTFGLFGVGQVIDLMRLRGMVDDENLKQQALQALAEKRALGPHARQLALAGGDPAAALRIELTRAAGRHDGRLTVAQAVMETGRDFKVVEAAMDQMARDGYVDIDNSATGAVLYVFTGLSG